MLCCNERLLDRQRYRMFGISDGNARRHTQCHNESDVIRNVI